MRAYSPTHTSQYELLLDRSLLLISGSDSLEFIQSLVTNDIGQSSFNYSYLLNARGYYLFDFFVYKQNDFELYFDCATIQKEDIINILSLYRLASKVEIIDISSLYSVFYSTTALHDGTYLYCQKDPRYTQLGYRATVPKEFSSCYTESCQELYMADKYRYTIIDGYIDLVPGHSIPIEFANKEAVGFSFSKGCYIGQEIVSTIRRRGITRKKIHKLDLETEALTLNDKFGSLSQLDITDSNGIALGKVCSNHKNLGIGWTKHTENAEQILELVYVAGAVARLLPPGYTLTV